MSGALSLAVLAGGNSTRFGEDKALARLHGKPLLAHVLERTAGLADETFIVTNRPAAYAQFSHRLVGDVLPGYGALGGVYTALYQAAYPWVLCLACDMPLVNRSLVAYLLTLTEGVDVVMPCVNGLWEPMHAVWSRGCLAPIYRALERGDRRVVSFFPAVRVRQVTQAEVEAYDPEHLSFLNVNTPGQLAEIAQRLEG
jgi:molybdopterin-guanine dinucleotide biosynthesis protein A